MNGILGQLPPGLAGWVAADQMNRQKQAGKMQELQGILGMQGALMQQDAMQQQQQSLQSLIPQLTDPAARMLAQAGDVRGAIGRQFPMQPNRGPVVVAPGSALVDPNNPNKPLFQAPALPKEPSESTLAKLTRERDALPQGHPARAQYDQAISKLTTHAPAPTATVINRQESEFGKAVGKEMGDMYTGLLKADLAAPGTISKYQRLGSLLSDVNTGKFKGTITDMKAAAKSMGVDLNSLGVGDDVAPAQAARALSNQLALELRNPAGGAGMPGAMSDKDREFLLQSIPGLENDPGAISKMIEYRVKLAQREQAVAKKARDYRKKNGKFDEAFFDELSQWSNANPLFPQAAAPAGRTVKRTGKLNGKTVVEYSDGTIEYQ
jgi:hypothetical protein